MALIEAALRDDPTNAGLRLALRDMSERELRALTDRARQALSNGNMKDAAEATSKAQKLAPNDPLVVGLAKLIDERAHDIDALARARDSLKREDTTEAKQILSEVLKKDPNNQDAWHLLSESEAKGAAAAEVPRKLAAALAAPISIDFKEANLAQVFEILSKTGHVNFVFDKDIKTTQKTTVFLKDSTVGRALEVILSTNELEKKVLDDNTVLVYPSTPAKEKNYRALSVKAFYLSNGDAEAVANSLKSILKVKDVTVDKKENMVMLRDTRDTLKLASRIVSLHDLPDPEATMEIEILEVNTDLLTDLGIKYPDQLTLTPLSSTTGGTVTLNDILSLDRGKIGATLTPMEIHAAGTDSDVKTLANPRIRVKSRETAKVLIGDRVPNITTTSTATGFVADSVQYIDVGLKLELTPIVSIDNEVSIKVALEVSSITNQITTSSGTVAYQISTRTASTILRLRDGENQVLAGLINDSDTKTSNVIPGLGGFPILNRIFGQTSTERQKSEIVLSITPHIVRNAPRQLPSDTEFSAGTEDDLRDSSSGVASAGGATQTVKLAGAGAQESQFGGLGGKANGPTSPTTGSGLGSQSSTSGTDLAQSAAPVAPIGGGVGGPAPALIATTSGGSTSPLIWQGLTSTKVGDTFSLQLAINSPQAVSSLSYTLGFDPTVFSVVSVSEGDFLRQNGVATSFSQQIAASTGTISISDARKGNPGDSGASGSGNLLVLTLRALATSQGSPIQVTNLTPTGPTGAPLSFSSPNPETIVVSQ